ncbi:MAG: uL30 family ribosomal protein [Candidatus Pacearchaeota archaeon]
MEEKRKTKIKEIIDKEKAKKVETKNEKNNENSILAVIRIKGEVKVKPKIKETLYRLRLRKKYSCILVNSKNKNLVGMINTVKHFVAFGEIEKETLVKLIKFRAQKLDNQKFDSEKIADEIISGKKLKDLGFKPFFRLHPPRKGIKSKLQYPKGVLGDNHKDINNLIERML